MRVLLLRDAGNKPYTILVKGIFRKRYYQVVVDNGVFQLPVFPYKEDKA